MDDTPSDENEQVVDIYIVSTEETVAGPLKERLGKKEVRVAVFADEEKLKEANPGIQPDLLIFDVQGGKPEICEVIRRIKDDDAKRGIPVLALTTAATMEDLFRVLESEADNFIAPPYDLPDNLSLINDMTASPHEAPARGEIETQFRVRHDEKTYVFAATSRKLLDLLLSSFDVVVRKSAELSSLTTKLQTLNESAAELERTISRQNRATETMNERVRQKEQTITVLTQEREELQKILTQKTKEQDNLSGTCAALRQQVGKLQDTLSSSAEALETERELRRVAEGNCTAAMQHHEEFEKLSRQGYEKLERVNTDQAAAIGRLKEDLTKAGGQIQSLQAEIATLTAKKSHAEQQVGALTESAVGLERVNTDQAAEIGRLKEDLTNAAGQVQSLQAELATLTTEKLHADKEVLALTKSAADLEQTMAGQTQAIETVNVTVRQKEQAIVALTQEREELKKVLAQKTNEQIVLTSACDTLRQQAGRLQETIDSANVALVTERESRRVAEENEKLTAQRNDDFAKKIRSAQEELERVTQERAVVIGQLKEELNKASGRIQSLESDITTLATKKLYAEQGVRALTESAALRERASTDQAAVVAQLNEELRTATGRIQSLEAEVTTLAADKLHAELEIRTLTTELGRTRTLLANEYQSHPGIDKQKSTDEENDDAGSEIPPVVSGLISQVSGRSDADDLFFVHEHDAEKKDTVPGPVKDHHASDEKTLDAFAREKSSAGPDRAVQSPSYVAIKPEKETVEKREPPDTEAVPWVRYDETAEESGGTAPLGDISFTTQQWLDLLKWSHHTDTLSQSQRQKIVMMGRLVQKDGKLTKKHQDQVREILSFVYARGYRPG